MSSGLLVAIEMVAILGLVLIFGVWQLWSLRRDNARAKAEQDARRTPDTTEKAAPLDARPPPD